MTNKKFHQLFGGPPREQETNLTQKEMDLARSVQEVTEEIMLRQARHLHKVTGQKNLVIGRRGRFELRRQRPSLAGRPVQKIWIQPATSNAGGALGAAMMAWYQYKDNPRQADGVHDPQKGSYLGPGYSNADIKSFLEKHNLPFTELSDEELPEKVADILSQEKIVGWFNGRMGSAPAPWAPAASSAIRVAQIQAQMNLKIKFRESFRPFAPAVLAEHVSEWFDINCESPYMLLVAPVKKEKCRQMTSDEDKLWGIEKLNVQRSEIPAVTHVDYSARIQTVHKETHPMYYRAIESFNKKTATR